MSQDITFCANADCKNKKCFRHQSNIINRNIPHSFADFTHTDDCPMRAEMTDEQAIKELQKYHLEDGTIPEEFFVAIKALEFIAISLVLKSFATIKTENNNGKKRFSNCSGRENR